MAIIFNLSNLNINEDSNGIYQIKVINSYPGQSNTNRPGLPENTYTGNLDIYAGYLNAEVNLGEKWLLVPGIRLESISQKIAFDVINLGNLSPGQLSFYDNVFLKIYKDKFYKNLYIK